MERARGAVAPHRARSSVAPGRRLYTWLCGFAVVTILLAACGPQQAAEQSNSAGANGGRQPGQVRTPKVLTIAAQRAPDDLHDDLGQRDPGVGGVGTIFALPHDTLVVDDEQGGWRPRLAVEELSFEQGTWKVNPDNTMETTWKLHPNVNWHDGTPFTSADLAFAFAVYKDPDVPNGIGAPLQLMESVSTPDSLTFVVHWSRPYLEANRAVGLIPMPKHIFEEIFTNDKANLINSPRLTTEWVGLGPYRLAKWELGSHLEFVRFDDYYLGRPPLDAVIVRLIPDANALVANILSGAVDVILSDGLDLDAAVEMKQRWEGTGNQVIIQPARAGGGLRHLEIQYRPEYEQPKPGLPNLSVRRALMHATDRQQLTQVITHGYGPIADSWVPPYHTLRPQYESAIPQYPFDRARAQQLLAQAGWTRGPDGTLVQPNGDRFEIQLYSSNGAQVERAIAVIAGDWKAVGADMKLHVIPIALAGDREYRAKLQGAGFTGGVGYDAFSTDRLHSKFISAPANRWAASNRGGYVNARADDIIDRIVVTLDPAQQVAIKRELLTEHTEDLAVMPLFWDIRTVPALKGIKGMEFGTWDLFHWDKD